VCDPRRRDAALDHDRLVRVARLDLVGDHVSPEGAEPLAVVPVVVVARRSVRVSRLFREDVRGVVGAHASLDPVQ